MQRSKHNPCNDINMLKPNIKIKEQILNKHGDSN